MNNFWKHKLAAYLHDPPSKALDIQTHGERSDAAFRQAEFTDAEVGEYFAHADHTGAAADRLPFPRSQAAALQCAFDGIRNAFRHPLNGKPLPFHKEFVSVEAAFEGENSIQPKLTADSLAALPDDATRWQARFFAHWRLWPRHATQRDYRLALLPADTRIPDHSIWTHMQVVSALDGCANQPGKDAVLAPAFLKFQLGPVQDFIAAARSIRDLWSGSYLLSWLMAVGLKKLSELVGPDAVIFPNLREQPLLDLHWREALWSKVSINDQQSVWDSLKWEPRDLLTPNLPNVFLAVVPAAEAGALAKEVAEAIQAEWSCIADAVWKECKDAKLTADERNERGEVVMAEQSRKHRFDTQVKRFLSLSWQVTPWPDSLEKALQLADGFAEGMPIQQARARVQAIVDMAQKQMPQDHRDGRFYTDATKTKLNNLGLGWSVILALNSWQLDAVRQTRVFSAANPGGWQVGTFSNKDALTGREEAVADGRTWAKRAKEAGAPWATLFKHDDWLGAATLIKRTWHRAYLAAGPWNLKTDAWHFPMPNTRGIAGHEPENDCGDDETAADAPPSEKYFAVLAFDGDEIGKWISGEKTPKFSSQLADYTDASGNPGFGAKPYFARPEFGKFLEAQRPLSPSYHLQFSEALSNFALQCARPVVEAFDGRLIYAGGDDVVALLPADTSLACAQALRMAFQGDPAIKETLRRHAAELRDRHQREQARDPKASPPPYYQKLAAEGSLLHTEHPGFLQRLDQVDQQNRPIPFLVPGPAADCSVGIAIAHFKAPLQDVVRSAWDAEDRAKKKLGRSAVAVTLCKRSGETIEWGAKWGSSGLEIYRRMADALERGEVSSRFPHRIVALLEAYLTETSALSAKSVEHVSDFDAASVIEHELDHVIDRQGASQDAKAALRQEWLESPGGPSQPSRLRRFLRWTTEEECRAAAGKLAEKLATLDGGKADSSDQKRLCELARMPVSDDSKHQEEFRAIAQGLSEKEPNEHARKAVAYALEALEKRLPEVQLRALIGLCQTVAFAHRTAAETTNPQPTGT